MVTQIIHCNQSKYTIKEIVMHFFLSNISGISIKIFEEHICLASMD